VPRKVEIKARIAAVGALRPVAAEFADAGPTPIAQETPSSPARPAG